MSDRIKYKEAFDRIKGEISYMPLELKKKLEKENIVLWRKKSKNSFNMISIL